MSDHKEGEAEMASDAKGALIGKRFPVLDKGHVELIDVMGDDHAICDAARLSYGKGTKSVSDDRALIRYLLRNRHTSPFEMAELKFAFRMPQMVWWQMVRHRTASCNVESGRYSEMSEDMMETPPDGWRLQSEANKQGSDGTVTEWPEGWEVVDRRGRTFYRAEEGWDSADSRPGWVKFSDGDDDGYLRVSGPPDSSEIVEAAEPGNVRFHKEDGGLTPGWVLTQVEDRAQYSATSAYKQRLAFGVAREQARGDLPMSVYIHVVWKINLHNLLHFLALRMDGHAQQEIREYAGVIGHEIIYPLFPTVWEAFQDYTLRGMSLSGREQRIIWAITQGDTFDGACVRWALTNKREIEECREKLGRLGLTTR